MPVGARLLIDSIEVTTIVEPRERALIGIMTYSFARIGAVLGTTPEDVHTQNRQQLREKRGKAHAMPCRHDLDSSLTAYIKSTSIAGDPKGPLFRTIGRIKRRPLTSRPN